MPDPPESPPARVAATAHHSLLAWKLLALPLLPAPRYSVLAVAAAAQHAPHQQKETRIMQQDTKPDEAARAIQQDSNAHTTIGSSQPNRWRGTVVFTTLVIVALGAFLIGGNSVFSNRTHAQPTPTVLPAGTLLSPLKAAPDFALTDQNGQTISLRSLRGHVVVLTFMDATCQQECPIEMGYLNLTAQFLGAQRTGQIDWLSVTINPTNTPAQATQFLTQHQAAMPMHFLLGAQTQLAQLWKAYAIQVIPGANDIAHTSGLYLLDQQGREVEWVDVPFDSKALATDLMKLQP